jgi:uncharacterized protein
LITIASETSEVRDNMRIDWDVPITMDDGVVLRADIFRPVADGEYATVASMGCYGKGLPFQDPPYDKLWQGMCEKYPDVPRGSTNKYQAWEVADPEKWVPLDYAIVRIDSRGAGRSEGVIDCYSKRETKDLYECIEWAAKQPWSNGKVGLSGISYYAMNQWQVAILKPPHLAAICPWEGAADWYRDVTHQGGIHCTFLGKWFEAQAMIVQYGLGSKGAVNPLTGLQVCGDVDLSDEERARNRRDLEMDPLEHRFDDEYYAERSSDFSKIDIPLLSTANWGGQALHERSNLRGFMLAASKEKWLEVHGGEHWAIYYTDYGRELQQRFFDWFLKGEGDWDQQPPVLLQIRHVGERFAPRAEQEWPLARTAWTPMHLHMGDLELSSEPAEGEETASYQGFGDGLTLSTAPFNEETELTGPVVCRLWVSSSTTDADLFLALRVFDPNGHEVLFHGANEPQAPISLGWLRASHRKLDESKSEPWAPYHSHLAEEPLTPGEVYPLDIEIWPTCIVIPKDYTLRLTILGRDFDHGLKGIPHHLGTEMHGQGIWNHDDPRERPPEVFDNTVTIHSGGDHQSYLTLPFIPEA